MLINSAQIFSQAPFFPHIDYFEDLITVIHKGNLEQVTSFIRLRRGQFKGVEGIIKRHPLCELIRSQIFTSSEKCDLIRILLENGIDIDAKEANGSWPLYEAILHNETSLVELLLSYNANPNQTDKYNNALLICALILKSTHHPVPIHIKNIQLLMDYGADLNQKSSLQSTILNIAILNNRPDAVEELLKRKYPPNQKDPFGYPLMRLAMCWMKYDPVITCFLKYGADPNAIDCDGTSTFSCAVDSRKVTLIDKFLLYGADIDLKNKYNESPVDIALKRNNLSIFKKMIEHKIKKLQAQNHTFPYFATIQYLEDEYTIWKRIPHRDFLKFILSFFTHIKENETEKKRLVEHGLIKTAIEQEIQNEYLQLLQTAISRIY